MDRDVYAKLNQGIDSFLRVAMTLRRKEVDIKSIIMTTDINNNVGMQLSIDDEKTSIEEVINHIKKLHDIEDLRIGTQRFNKLM